MTNETPEPSQEITEPVPDDVVERVMAHQRDLNELALEIPATATASRDLVTFYSVFIDENGQMDPPQDRVNVQFMRSIMRLESRIISLENRLGEAGIA